MAGDVSVQDWNGNFFLRFGDNNDLGPLRWSDFIDGALAGDTAGIIRYTSPTRYGFNFDAAWGENDYWDAALRYSRVWGNAFWVKGAIGYWSNRSEEIGADEPTEDEGWGGSIAIRHVPSGLNLAFNYATEGHTDN